eukprot:m.74358 g.74358  ORF g.74358 m.74358 type:complete len:259 (-) comp13938_c0_seq1:406-1182(-)
MPRYALNLGFVYASEPLLQRLVLARRSGFSAVELAFDQYEMDVHHIADNCKELNLTVSLINTPKGRWEAGERGLAAVPGREDDFWTAFSLAVHHAKALSCSKIHVMSGVVPPEATEQECHDTFVRNLRRAAPVAQEANLTLLLEPISTIPSYYMDHVKKARRAISEVASSNIKYQFDAYHAQMTHGCLAKTILDNADILGHVQIAGVPGRNEPDANNEINYPYLLQVLDQVYDGFIGCEYIPSNPTTPDFAWMNQYMG